MHIARLDVKAQAEWISSRPLQNNATFLISTLVIKVTIALMNFSLVTYLLRSKLGTPWYLPDNFGPSSFTGISRLRHLQYRTSPISLNQNGIKLFPPNKSISRIWFPLTPPRNMTQPHHPLLPRTDQLKAFREAHGTEEVYEMEPGADACGCQWLYSCLRRH